MSRIGTSRKRSRATLAVVAALALGSLIGAPANAASSTARGPSTTTNPYVLPIADGVHITSLLTVGDGSAGNGYRMVGIPDGLGMIRQGANLVLYSNHELTDTEGIVRRHGQKGSFVSRWVIDPTTLRFKEGSDLINPGVQFWDYPSGAYVTSGAQFADSATQDLTFGRFCSNTLSDPGQFYNGATKNGYEGQLLLTNEEDTDNGRSFAITKDGGATALPRLGLFAWENTKPAANATDTTLVIGDEDGPIDGSQLWVYVGAKQKSGPPVAKAGLTNGDDHVLAAVNATVTTDALWRSTYHKTAAAVKLVDNDWNSTGALQNSTGKTDGLNLNRIEDGHWDPSHPNDFYFVTTQGGVTGGTGLNAFDTGGLWRLRWNDIEDPDAGATLQLLLDGSEPAPGGTPLNKIDNMAIDQHGNILIQEDPGNNNHIARIVAYRISDGELGVVAKFDPSLFSAGATDAALPQLTVDEETSGIIDTENFLGAGTFFFDAQVHTKKGLPAGTGPGTVGEFVERGQYLMLKVDDWSGVYLD